jgi:hypothetical protein
MARRRTSRVVREVRPERRCRRRATDASSSQADSETEHTMQLATVMAAESTTWPEAAITIAGIALVASVAVAVVWQALATWRARIAVTREQGLSQAGRADGARAARDQRARQRPRAGQRAGRTMSTLKARPARRAPRRPARAAGGLVAASPCVVATARLPRRRPSKRLSMRTSSACSRT